MGGKCTPSGGIEIITGGTRIPRGPGRPNSRKDLLDEKGNKFGIRWYDANGNELWDRDYTDHGFPEKHPEVPHDHPFKKDKNGKTQRQSKYQTPNGVC